VFKYELEINLTSFERRDLSYISYMFEFYKRIFYFMAFFIISSSTRVISIFDDGISKHHHHHYTFIFFHINISNKISNFKKPKSLVWIKSIYLFTCFLVGKTRHPYSSISSSKDFSLSQISPSIVISIPLLSSCLSVLSGLSGLSGLEEEVVFGLEEEVGWGGAELVPLFDVIGSVRLDRGLGLEEIDWLGLGLGLVLVLCGLGLGLRLGLGGPGIGVFGWLVLEGAEVELVSSGLGGLGGLVVLVLEGLYGLGGLDELGRLEGLEGIGLDWMWLEGVELEGLGGLEVISERLGLNVFRLGG
jgi:hypothetical protein